MHFFQIIIDVFINFSHSDLGIKILSLYFFDSDGIPDFDSAGGQTFIIRYNINIDKIREFSYIFSNKIVIKLAEITNDLQTSFCEIIVIQCHRLDKQGHHVVTDGLICME